MRLVERPIVEQFFMHGTGGDEHEPPHGGLSGGLNQFERAEHVSFDEL